MRRYFWEQKFPDNELYEHERTVLRNVSWSRGGGIVLLVQLLKQVIEGDDALWVHRQDPVELPPYWPMYVGLYCCLIGPEALSLNRQEHD